MSPLRVRLRVAVGLLLGLGPLPLAVGMPAPLTDWPNHIARVFIGVSLLRREAFWQPLYALNVAPVPNEALDVGIGALHWAGLDVDRAAMVFLLVAYAVFVGGVCRLARATGALGFGTPVLGSIFFVTGPLMYGLVNYLLGLGLAFGLAGWWLDGAPRRRWLIALAGAPCLFLVHLLAAAVWALLLLCFEAPALAATMRARGWPRGGGSSLAACLLAVLLMFGSEAGGTSLPHADGTNVWFVGHFVPWPTLRWKLGIFLRTFADHASVPVAAATVAGLLFAALLATLRGRPRLGAGAALGAAVLLFLVLALPEAAGSGSLLDYRMALPLFALLAATVRLEWRSAAWRNAACAAVAAVALIRSVAFAADFATQNATYRAFDTAAAALPEGSLLLAARGQRDEDLPLGTWWSPPMEHVGTRAVYRRVFVPTVFARASQQPVVLRESEAAWRRSWRIADATELEGMLADIRPLCVPPRIDARPAIRRAFVFIAYPGAFIAHAVPEEARVGAGPGFVIADPCRIVVPPASVPPASVPPVAAALAAQPGTF